MSGQFAIQVQSPEALAAQLANIAFYKLPPDYLQTYLLRLRAVPLADVNRIAQTYFMPESLSLILVAPAAKVKSQLAGLGNNRNTPRRNRRKVRELRGGSESGSIASRVGQTAPMADNGPAQRGRSGRLVQRLEAKGTALVPVGGGTQLQTGYPPSSEKPYALLSTRRLEQNSGLSARRHDDHL